MRRKVMIKLRTKLRMKKPIYVLIKSLPLYRKTNKFERKYQPSKN